MLGVFVLKRAEWRRPKHRVLPTLQDWCVDTRSFAEVAEVTQGKFCQEVCCRARQRPQEYVLCVYVWLYSDSFYQFRNDVGSWTVVSIPFEDRLKRGGGSRGRVAGRVVGAIAMRCD